MVRPIHGISEPVTLQALYHIGQAQQAIIMHIAMAT